MEVLELIQVGIHSSIQDQGRFGQRGYAIPQSGFLDEISSYLANHLVGNSQDAAVIEILGGRFECLILEEIYLGIVGVGAEVKLNEQSISNESTLQLKKRDKIKIEAQGSIYMAIASGFLGQSHFESCSTYPLAQLGGLNGGILKTGDRLAVEAILKSDTIKLPEQVVPKAAKHQIIRVLKGPELRRLASTDLDSENRKWTISSKSNRMGIRLEGDCLTFEGDEMNSVPTFPGTIQLTNEGLPIVLMNDAQTTGGYPRIGQVIAADLPRLVRMILGGTITFKFVDISEARYIFNKKEAFLKHALE